MTTLETHDVPEGVDPDAWRLDVTGAVTREVSFGAADLDALPTETFTADFTCVEGWVAEDCSWRGVRVGDVLDSAEPTAESGHALVHAMDGGYACAFPLSRLPEAVLATGLDGDPLPKDVDPVLTVSWDVAQTWP